MGDLAKYYSPQSLHASVLQREYKLIHIKQNKHQKNQLHRGAHIKYECGQGLQVLRDSSSVSLPHKNAGPSSELL